MSDHIIIYNAILSFHIYKVRKTLKHLEFDGIKNPLKIPQRKIKIKTT